jgi:hypothetical protein
LENTYLYFDDFDTINGSSTTSTTGLLRSQFARTVAGVQLFPSSSPSVKCSGMASLTGTTATSVGLVGALNARLQLGGSVDAGDIEYKARVRIGAFSQPLTRYIPFVGLGNFFNFPFTASSNSMGFIYSDDVNGGKWQAYVEVLGVIAGTADTGVLPTTNVYQTLRIYTTKTLATFYIDGVQVAQIAFATSTFYELNPQVGIRKIAGTGQQNINIDYIYCKQFITR